MGNLDFVKNVPQKMDSRRPAVMRTILPNEDIQVEFCLFFVQRKRFGNENSEYMLMFQCMIFRPEKKNSKGFVMQNVWLLNCFERTSRENGAMESPAMSMSQDAYELSRSISVNQCLLFAICSKADRFTYWIRKVQLLLR